jgi:hypothetical protein
MNHAVGETAFVQQFEVEADLVGESLVASSHYDGRDDQVDLVDQPGLERLGGEIGPTHAEVALRGRLQLPDGIRLKVSLDPRPGAGSGFQRLGVHDLVASPPVSAKSWM